MLTVRINFRHMRALAGLLVIFAAGHAQAALSASQISELTQFVGPELTKFRETQNEINRATADLNRKQAAVDHLEEAHFAITIYFTKALYNQDNALIAQRDGSQRTLQVATEKRAWLDDRITKKLDFWMGRNDEKIRAINAVIKNLGPLDEAGASVVSDLDSAKEKLSSAELAAGINMGVSAHRALSKQKGGLGDAIAQAAVQLEVSRALRDAQASLVAAGDYCSRMNQVRPMSPSEISILSGSFAGFSQRSAVYYLFTGRNPLTSAHFSLYNSAFQLGSLMNAKGDITKALDEIAPVQDEIHARLESLRSQVGTRRAAIRAQIEQVLP